LAQVVGEGDLWRDAGRQAGRQLQAAHRLGMAAGGNPADAVAGSQALGKGRHVQHQAVVVERLAARRRFRAEVEFVVDVVFDQRYLVPAQQVEQLPPGFGGDQAAGRVGEIEHQQAGLDRVALEDVAERGEIEAGARMAGDLDDFQAEPLAGLQPGVEGRRLDGDQVARPGHRLQAEVEAFHCAGGDDDLLRGDPGTAGQVAQRDLPAQFLVARRQVGQRRPRVEAAGGARQVAAERIERKQRRVGKARTERHDVGIADAVENPEDEVADLQLGRAAGRARDVRLGQAAARAGAHEVAGFRPGFDEAAALEQRVGLADRDRADAARAAGFADRRQAFAGAQGAGQDQLRGVLGERAVQAHGRALAVDGRFLPETGRRPRTFTCATP
jgi:hypothetical protein